MDIGSDKIEDLNPIKNLINLKELNMQHAASVSDISFVKSLENLEIIKAGFTNVIDISPLAYCKKLKR